MELNTSSSLSSPAMTRRLWRNAPWPVLFLCLAIAGLGVWNLASASHPESSPLWRSQINYILVGLVACFAVSFFDYRYLLRLSYPLYGGMLLLLLAVLLKGHSAMGARRWLDFGPVHLQPSELMKIGMIMVLARFYHDDNGHNDGYSLFHLWLPMLLVLAPVALVMKQPDLGTAVMIGVVAATMILFGKVRFKSLLVVGVTLLVNAVLVWGAVFMGYQSMGIAMVVVAASLAMLLFFMVRWESLLVIVVTTVMMAALAGGHGLKDYQKKRISTYLNPDGDTLGAGYHASQSLIAVGSGQGWGKGWGQGTQTQLSFLPEQHTDFIFSVWGEEHGLVGAVALIILYLLLLVAATSVAASAREKFGTFVAVGVTGMIFWQVFINIGMVTGILPVVGVTLPLMSYGGSSVVTIMVGLGLLMNIGMRRHLY